MGHLKRTKKHCLQLYAEDEIAWLEKKAKSTQREQTAKWKKENKEQANEHERKRYHRSLEKEKGEKIYRQTQFVGNKKNVGVL